MSLTLPFLLGPVFFRTALPCSGGYHVERDGMPLHNEVGINCRKGGNCQVYRLSGVLTIMCVCYLT